MNKTKKIILLSIIVVFIIAIIGLIFYGTKLTKKPAPIVEEKKEEIIETQPIETTEEKEVTEIKDCENLSDTTKIEECIFGLALKKEDPELCKNIPDRLSDCKQSILAIQLNNHEKCSDYNKDICITQLAIKNRSAALCRKANDIHKCFNKLIKSASKEEKIEESKNFEQILKDESTGWNIYRNLEYKFELKFPSNRTGPPISPIYFITDFYCDYSNFEEKPPDITDMLIDWDFKGCYSDPEERPLCLQNVRKKLLAPKSALPYMDLNGTARKIIINGIPFWRYGFEEGIMGGRTGYHDYFVTVKNKKCLSIYLYMEVYRCKDVPVDGGEDFIKKCEKENEETIKEHNQIISTFRFLE
jgi:hypothetical protein